MPAGNGFERRSRDQDDIHLSLRRSSRTIAAIPRLGGTSGRYGLIELSAEHCRIASAGHHLVEMQTMKPVAFVSMPYGQVCAVGISRPHELEQIRLQETREGLCLRSSHSRKHRRVCPVVEISEQERQL